MDGFVLGLFLFAAFIGGFASGVAGFAMGFIVSGIWLHLISFQTTALRRSLNWKNLAPFIIAGTISIPVGTLMLTDIDAAPYENGDRRSADRLAQAAGQAVCKPALSFKDAQLSPMQPPTFKRKWTATVTVDASRCASTTGYFDVGFSRMKENSMETEFREQFIWTAPSVLIEVEFSADEAVETYWIDKVQACPCAR